jgi:hypothetical protein
LKFIYKISGTGIAEAASIGKLAKQKYLSFTKGKIIA